MTPRQKRRRGIGTVITTLIILIASVVLAAGVIFFGGSLYQTNTQNEAIQVSNTHIWVSANGTSSIAGFAVQNTGGKVVAIQSITIRGQSVPVASWYYNTVDATAANIQKELTSDFTPASVNVNGVAGEEAFDAATGPITLAQGKAAFVYLANPSGISMIDAGHDASLNVHASSASSIVSVHVLS
jgi:filamentous hemagglutinin family protein